ncbi:MAG: tRNA pseudouridine(55) synthase TruB [Chloroflexota bacterium]
MSRKKKSLPPANPSLQAQSAALERLRGLLSEPDYTALLDELAQPLKPALRLNPLKAQPGQVSEWAQRYGWRLTSVPFCPTGWQVNEQRVPISQTLEHRLGHYYIQDAASMLPAELFDLNDAPRALILDLAASPGGKTTHLVSRTLDQSLVLANDAAAERITALRLVLQNWGTLNAAVTRFPAEKFGRWFPAVFDRVLLDAPCSMQSLRSTESHPMRPISTREQSSLARRQTAMLISALAAVKPGGQVVYSTCTLAPEENEAVLDAVLRRCANAVQIDSLASHLPAPAPALQSAFGQVFHPQISRAVRLWPHRFGTSGFFAARLTRTGEIALPFEPPPARPLQAVGQETLNQRQQREWLDFFSTHYGFDLQGVLESHRLALLRSPNGVYAVSQTFLERFAQLPCQMLGLKLVEPVPSGWQPTHDWISRFASGFHSGRLTLEEERVNPWLKGQDVDCPALPSGAPPAWLVLDQQGRFIGRGRCSAGRLKNLLPRRLI